MTALGGEPLPVEFCSGNAWYPGVLLGWRHEADGACRVRVRFVVGGLKRTSWLPLADLRLAATEPAATEPAAPPVPAPRGHLENLRPAPR